jgi:AraC family transcriptional regulator
MLKAAVLHPSDTAGMTHVAKVRPRISARLIEVPEGECVMEPAQTHRLLVHHGPPVYVVCSFDGLPTARHQRRPGDIDFVPAGSSAWWCDEGPTQIIALSLCPTVFSRAAARLARVRPEPLKPRGPLRDPALTTLARLAGLGEVGRDAFGEAIAEAIAVRIMALAPVDADSRVRPLGGRRLKAVLAFIDRHLDQALPLDDLAREAGLRRSHFAAAFRSATGQSPRQYVIRRRVERARALLASGGMSISEVAFQTGFAHQSHLARAVRRATGFSPRAIRDEGTVTGVLRLAGTTG